MFGLQPTDILGIVIVALILFGPSRLPELARGIGKGMKEFQDALKERPPSATEDTKNPLNAPDPASPSPRADDQVLEAVSPK